MSEPARDRWAEWLLRRRDGGDHEQREATLGFLVTIRDRVLANAALSRGETLLDVGAGDGLIAFGALEPLGENGRVIFADVSQNLLDHSRSLAQEAEVAERCEFLCAPATDLSALDDATVDAVTTRSVLIYVEDKRRAFEEFRRVLRPGGRLSIFEPINTYYHPEPPERFLGYDVTPVRDLARKVKAVFERIQPPDTDPMLNFDERDLLTLAEEAGFEEVHLTFEANVAPGNPAGILAGWDNFLNRAGNPRIPTIGEATAEALTLAEAEKFEQHLRPLVDRGERISRYAFAYLWTVK